MSEKNYKTAWQMQKEFKPKIEDISKEFVLKNIKIPPCTYNINCKGIQDVIILDNHFDSICKCWPFSILSPNKNQLLYLNQLIIALKNFIFDLK